MFKIGTQVAYLPTHAEHNIDHEDVEFGFVTSVDEERRTAWVRYWRGRHNISLRTTANSERTRFDLLVPHSLVPRRTVDYMLHELKYIDEAELTTRKLGW